MNTTKTLFTDADPTPPISKNYLTTKQFIVVWKSLDDDKYKELNAARDSARDDAWYAAWDAAWYAARDDAWYAAWDAARDAARDADLAIVVRDKITPDQFNTLVQPWTSCGLSLYAEDWEEVLNPKVVEPKNFGAIVEAQYYRATLRTRFFFNGIDWIRERTLENHAWSDLINPTIVSEGVEG